MITVLGMAQICAILHSNDFHSLSTRSTQSLKPYQAFDPTSWHFPFIWVNLRSMCVLNDLILLLDSKCQRDQMTIANIRTVFMVFHSTLGKFRSFFTSMTYSMLLKS